MSSTCNSVLLGAFPFVSFLVQQRGKLLYNSVFMQICLPCILWWWKVFWCTLGFCCQIPLCLGMSKNVLLCTFRAEPCCKKPPHPTAPRFLTHHTLLGSKQMLCSPLHMSHCVQLCRGDTISMQLCPCSHCLLRVLLHVKTSANVS